MQLQRYKKPLMKAGALLAAACLGFALLPLLLPFLLAYLLASAAGAAVAAPAPRPAFASATAASPVAMLPAITSTFG